MQPPSAHGHARRLLLFVHLCATVAAVVKRSARSAITVAGSAAANGSAAIVPALRPVSDKKFFGVDYPDDRQPEEHNLAFRHPYPHVQDTRAYDKDFVSDENSDNGEWKAQTVYDRLRIDFEKVEAKTKKALERQTAARNATDVAKASETAAEGVSEDAEKNTAEAQRHLEEAQREVDALVGNSSGRPQGGEIGEAVRDVNREVKDVQACERELASAQAKLAQLKKERKAQDQQFSAAQKEAADAKAKAGARYESVRRAENEKLGKEFDEPAAQMKYAEAVAQYRASEAKLAALEAEVKAAAQRLTEARRTEDSNGGVYYTRKSAAHGVAGTLAPAAVVVVAWMLHLTSVL